MESGQVLIPLLSFLENQLMMDVEVTPNSTLGGIASWSPIIRNVPPRKTEKARSGVVLMGLQQAQVKFVESAELPSLTITTWRGS